MFNDRDLAILGAGAVLAVLCLLLPIPFAIRAVIGILVLVGFMAAALLRLGPDRVPLEEWVKRRMRYQRAARRYTNQAPDYREAKAAPAAPLPLDLPPAPEPEQAEDKARHAPAPSALPSPSASIKPSPVYFAVSEVGIYPLVTVFLAVIGVYFLVWLVQGGGEELGMLFKQLIGG